MVSEVGRTVWLLMFCLDGRPSFQKFSLSPSYLAEVVLSLSPTTQPGKNGILNNVHGGSRFAWILVEKKGSELPLPELKNFQIVFEPPLLVYFFSFYGCPTENLIFLSVKMLLFCIRRISAKVIQPACKVRRPEGPGR